MVVSLHGDTSLYFVLCWDNIGQLDKDDYTMTNGMMDRMMNGKIDGTMDMVVVGKMGRMIDGMMVGMMDGMIYI